MKFTIVILFLFFQSFLFKSNVSAQLNIKGSIKNYAFSNIYFTNIYGEKNKMLDSAKTDFAGNFSINIKPEYHIGLYKFFLAKNSKIQNYNGKEPFINIILNNENIEFSTYLYNIVDSMKITKSEENKMYYKFLQTENKMNSKLDALTQMTSLFPSGDDFYSDIEKQYNKLQKKQQEFLSDIQKKNQGSFASRLIKSRQFPTLEFTLSNEEKSRFIKQHFLDNIDFRDTLLLYTDLFTSKSIGYLQQYRSQGINKEQQETEFIKAVDTIMTRSNKNIRIQKQIRDYLIHGFEMLDMNKALAHISERYAGTESCEDDKQAKNLKLRIDGFKKLAIGTNAPEIILAQGNPAKLSDIKIPFTLVIFWASWCPHCKETLPELKNIYEQQKNKQYEVVAISLDSSKTEYAKILQKENFKWINHCDFKSWNGRAALDYFLYATPSMFLLDKDKKILAKPTTYPELIEQLRIFNLL